MQQEKTQVEYSYRDLQRQYTVNENDRNSLLSQLNDYIVLKKAYEEDKHIHQKELLTIQSKYDSMVVQLQEKEQQIDNLTTLSQAYLENKTNLEARILILTKQLSDLEGERKRWEEKYLTIEKRNDNKQEEIKEYYETLMQKNEMIRKHVSQPYHIISYHIFISLYLM